MVNDDRLYSEQQYHIQFNLIRSELVGVKKNAGMTQNDVNG
jgi:hypothetical protein